MLTDFWLVDLVEGPYRICFTVLFYEEENKEHRNGWCYAALTMHYPKSLELRIGKAASAAFFVFLL